MVTTPAPAREARAQPHLLPRTPLGRWGFGLLLAAAACPAYWAVLTPLIKHSDPEATIRSAIMIVITVPALVVGSAALARRDAWSVLLVAVAAIVAIEIAWIVFFVAEFDNALLGLCIVLGAAISVLAGVLLAARGMVR